MFVLVIVIAYEVISIGGVSLYLYLKNRGVEKVEGEFASAGRSLPAPVVGASIALAVLGCVHVLGIMEATWMNGAVSVWFSISHVTLICVICLVTGRFVRRLKVATVPELYDLLYNDAVRKLVVAVVAGQTFAILTMEVQGLGVIINALSQNAIPVFWATVVGVVIGVAYVFLAGMKEIGWVNLINTIVMYIGLIIAIAFIAPKLMGGGGWDAVEAHFTSNPETSHMVSIFGTMGKDGTFVGLGLALVISVTFAQSISQMGLQSTTAAKSEKTVARALWIAAPVNGLFGIFTMAIGLAARANIEAGHVSLPEGVPGPKAGGLATIMQLLPEPVVGLLLAAFLGAVLSTFAITTLSLGTMFVRDIYMQKNPNITEKEQTKYIRIFIVLAGIAAIIAASFMPGIINGANWAFAWLAPIFFNTMYGLFWKRSSSAAITVFIVSWVLVLLWTFTPLFPSIGLGWLPIPYVTLAVSLVLGIILNLILPGKPGYFRELKERKANGAA